MPAVSKESLSRPASLKVVQVPLPCCGEGQYANVRELGSRDLVELQAQFGSKAELSSLAFLHQLLSRSLVDDEGKLLFASPSELADCFNLPLAVLMELTKTVLQLSGLEVSEKN